MQNFTTTLFMVLFVANSVFADKVIVMEDPIKSLETRVELIMHAKKTIDVQYFTIEHDYISVAGLALLREAAKRGVKVRVIVDSMHNLMTREMMSAFLDNLDATAEKNIEIREFNKFNIFKPFCYTRRMHDKSLIIDGQYLIVGDRNVANGYYDIPDTENGHSLPSFQGTDALIAGTKSITEASSYFEQRWNSKDVKPVIFNNYSASKLDYSYCSYKPLSTNDTSCEWQREQAVKKIKIELEKLNEQYAFVTEKNSKVILEQPTLKALATAYETEDIQFIHDDATTRVCNGKNPEKNIAKTLYETIAENTHEDLIIMTPYLVVTPEMVKLIKKLVEEKDIFVRFITNSIESNDVPAATAGYLKTRHLLMNIKNAKSGRGVRIYEFTNFSNPKLVDGKGTVLKQGKAIDTVHAKVVLMDNKKAFIGSYNWDFRSQNLNSEVGVIIGLEGSKTINPTSEIRNKMAKLLKTSKIVSADGTTNDENKIKVILTAKEQLEFDTIIAARKEGAHLWQRLLNLPIIGDFLLNQL